MDTPSGSVKSNRRHYPVNSGGTRVERPLRADARRNRERLIEVAQAAFAEHGVDAPMDDIARRAQVGPGTLYRHFPTREALLLAVYRSDIERIAERARVLGEE